MKRGFLRKILFSYILIGILIPILSYAVLIPLITMKYDHQTIVRLENQAQHLKAVFEHEFPAPGNTRLQQLTDFYAHLLQLRITICGLDGTVLADSDLPVAGMQNHANRPEIRQALSGRTGISLRYSASLGRKMIYVAIPLETGQQRTAIFRLAVATSEISHQLFLFRLAISLYLLITLLAVLIILTIQNRRIHTPLQMVLSTMHEMEEMDPSLPAHQGKSEISQLVERLRQFSQQLSDDAQTIRTQRLEIKTILGAIHDIVWIQTDEENVLLANKHFDETFASSLTQPKAIWEIVLDKDLLQQIRSLAHSNQAEPASVTYRDRSYLLTGEYLGESHLTVFLMRDITQWKLTEQMKKDFILNVAHELRTPLTIIRGYAETLEEAVDDEAKTYLKIIHKNLFRLNHFVEDLQALSLLEQKPHLYLESLNLRLFLDNTREIYHHALRDAGLSLTIDLEENLPDFTADPCRLEQVFTNLIDNAIRYTREGGVTIRAAHEGNYLLISISDTGIGIPKEHLPRIFERFYVVDPSRNRKTGGTGLGLAIVKHIILLHHGTVEVQSEPGCGTTFLIRLPLQQAETSP